jgi:hypothetical protein
MLADVWQFIIAVSSNWAGYATGGTIVASAWLYYSWKDTAMPRIIALSLCFIFQCMAVFKAWEDKNRDLELLKAKLAIPEFVMSHCCPAKLLRSGINVFESGEYAG